MKITSFTKILKESNGNLAFDVIIPSTQETITCKVMTAGQRKTLSKAVMGSSETQQSVTFKKAAVGIIKELVVDGEFDESVITYLDFVSVLSQLMNYTLTEPLAMNIKCPKCDKQFEFNIKFDVFKDKIATFKFDPFTFENTDKSDNKFEFTVSSPTIQDNIDIEEYFKSLKDEGKTVTDFTFLYIIACICEIKYNGQEVEEFKSLTFKEKIDVMDNFPGGVVVGGKSSIVSQISKSDIIKGLNVISEDISCPFSNCKHSLEGAITFDSFFIL